MGEVRGGSERGERGERSGGRVEVVREVTEMRGLRQGEEVRGMTQEDWGAKSACHKGQSSGHG